MKATFRIHHSWDYIFSIFLIALHVHLGLCRPARGYVDSRIGLQNSSVSDDHPHVKLMRDSSVTDRLLGMREVKDYDTAQLLYSQKQKDFIYYLLTSPDDVSDLDDMPTGGDVSYDVIPDKEGLVLRPFIDRNLVRKRRQPETQRHHKRRRRKHHRLVLKARDDTRNHLSDGKGDFKDRHIIKSDSPGYVITSASEVKKDWCKTIPLRHKVSEINCRSRVVQNNFCYGQCNSFFIPHTSRTDTKTAFQSCAVCRPVRQHWGNVTLNCPGNNPPKVIKTVLFVDECRCMSDALK